MTFAEIAVARKVLAAATKSIWEPWPTILELALNEIETCRMLISGYEKERNQLLAVAHAASKAEKESMSIELEIALKKWLGEHD